MTAMIDSGANNSYISKNAIKKYKIRPQLKQDPYTVSTVEEKDIIRNDGWITHQTPKGQLKVETHLEQISLDTIHMKDDILLRKS